MKLVKVCGVLGFAALISQPVYAQSQSYENIMNEVVEAYSENRLEDALDKLDQAQGLSFDLDQELSIVHASAVINTELKRFDTALASSSRCVDIFETTTVQENSIQDDCIEIKRAALYALGRPVEAATVENPFGAFRQAWEDVYIWTDERGDITQNISGFKCPNIFNQMVRTNVQNYDALGSDNGCTYESADGKVLVSAYMTLNYANSGKAIVDSYDDLILGKYQSAQEVSGSETLISEWTGPGDLYGRVFRYTATGNDGYTGVWAAVIGDWTYKTRVTWNSSLGETEGQKQSLGFLSQNINELERLDANCGTAATEYDGQLADGDNSTLLSALLFGNALTQMVDGAESDSKDQSRPPCLVLGLEHEDLSIFMSQTEPVTYKVWRKNGPTGIEVRPSNLGLSEVDDVEQRYVMSQTDDDTGIFSVYFIFEGVPNVGIVRDMARQVLDGQAPGSSVDFSEGGGGQITINMPPDEADEE